MREERGPARLPVRQVEPPGKLHPVMAMKGEFLAAHGRPF